MKKTKLVCFSLLIIVLVVAISIFFYIFSLFGGVDYTKYPYEKSAIWVCEEPRFELNFENVQDTYLVWGNDEIQVFVGLHANYFDVYRQTNPSDPLEQKNILLRGTWRYVRGKMVVTIDEDNIFGGVHKELVFAPQ